MRPILLGLLAATLLADNAEAQRDILSANYLVPACQRFIANNGTLNDAETGYCAGVITGLGYLSAGSPPDFRSCGPEGVTITQMTRVALAYIERHPQRMHEPFARLAVEAWHEAWPCK